MSKVIESVGLRGRLTNKNTEPWVVCTHCALCQEAIPIRAVALRFLFCDYGAPARMSRKTRYVHTGCIPLFGLIATTEYEIEDQAASDLAAILERYWTQEIPVVDAEGSQLGLDLRLGGNHA